MKVAIYSRKSKITGKGDSIENQIEICKNYITSHFPDESYEFVIYEDEGFSGGNINRPQFKQLMKDIRLKKVHILICYRLDRISRNVSDFSSILEVLQEYSVDFISVRDQFDTHTPMGRAMIYVASVFAQLERETIAERVKDNMLEMAKNGKWTGGKTPLGFISKREKITIDGTTKESSILVKNPTEVTFIKMLYEKYLELGSLNKLEVYTHQNDLRSASGKIFEKSTLKIILQNPVYVMGNEDVVNYLENHDWIVYGEVDDIHSLLTYNKTQSASRNGKIVKVNRDISERFAAVSNIEGFIEPDLWLKVQKQFDRNRDTFPHLGKTHNVLLAGKLKCGICGNYMLVQHGRVTKDGQKSFFYVCSLKRKSKKSLCSVKNVKSSVIEACVLKHLKQLSIDKKQFLNDYKSYLNKMNNSSSISDLEKSLAFKEKQIDNLVTKLSIDNDISEILIDKIKALKQYCKQITSEISKAKENLEINKIAKIDLSLVEDIIDQCSNIDKLSKERQKKIIDVLIETIYYYPPDDDHPKGKIRIKFIGASEKSDDILGDTKNATEMLHFSSPSMTCI
ncbi:MAG: recombinase family protein [Clostridium sp.]